MSDIFEIKNTAKIRTTESNKEFYKLMVDKGIFDNQHQLFTYAFLVAIYENLKPNKDVKTEDICFVDNILNKHESNFNIVKGIALMKLDAENGDDLLRQMLEYADAGIKVLRKEYENDGVLRLDKYID